MELKPALGRAIRNVQPRTPPPATLRGMVRYVGGTDALAVALAGTDDRRSRAYRTARQNVRRWLDGIHQPSEESLARVQHATQAVAQARAGESIRPLREAWARGDQDRVTAIFHHALITASGVPGASIVDVASLTLRVGEAEARRQPPTTKTGRGARER